LIDSSKREVEGRVREKDEKERENNEKDLVKKRRKKTDNRNHLKLTASGESLQNSSRGSALVCAAFLWDSAAEISSTWRKKWGSGFCWWKRSRKNRVRVFPFFLARCFFRFLSSSCFFNESIQGRSRPFWPRSARPRAMTRSTRPRRGGGTQAQAFNSAQLSLD
jgi:hypothetical protein